MYVYPLKGFNTRHKKLWQNQLFDWIDPMYTANVNSLLMNFIFHLFHPLRTMITQWVFTQIVLKISITFVIFFSFSLFQLEGWSDFIQTCAEWPPDGSFCCA